MSNFSDFIGGGGGSFPTIFLHKSQTFVPPQDGNIMIHVIGAGGSGAASNTSTNLQSGAAGGYCRKNSLAVTTSGSFTVVIGAGGVAVIKSASAGTAGGTTTVAGTGLSSTLTATGGAAGALTNGTYTTAGVGSNGDLNTTGGRGGYAIGGGAVGLLGTGKDGVNGDQYQQTRGGACDILGDFYSSSLGQISGGHGGCTVVQNYGGMAAISHLAEPLAGGSGVYQSTTPQIIRGADAVIGGGGGFCYNNSGANALYSGRGGEGCVVIQYIP